MAGASRDRLQAGLKALYAKAVGITDRQARRDFNANPQPDRLLRWLAEQKIETAAAIGSRKDLSPVQQITAHVMTAPVRQADPPPPATGEVPFESLPEPERAMRQQWTLYDQACKSWHAATVRSDEMLALSLGRNTTLALTAYKQARRDWEQWQADNRMVVPIAETGSLEQAMKAMAALIQTMPDEVAMTANPGAPGIARAAALDWINNRFAPTMIQTIEELRALAAA